MKKVLILGNDGYIGRALHQHLLNFDTEYDIVGIDNKYREKAVLEIGGGSVVDIKWRTKLPRSYFCDLLDYEKLLGLIEQVKPDAIVHLAEQPSAPYSMIDQQKCLETQKNNILGTMNVLWAIRRVNPKIHLIKLGTAGEYPDWLYPNMVIPEGGRIKVDHTDYKGKKYSDWEIPTPRYAGSFYHMTKLHDSNNIDYACRIWGLRCTDINQAPVYGHMYDTRLDVDEYFGTVVNRFCAQAAIGHNLTVYGTGGQTRGYIHIQNSLEAIKLIIDNPAENGEFKVIHQTTQEKTVSEIADIVRGYYFNLTGNKVKIENVDNPRFEKPENDFEFEAQVLKDLGLKVIKMEDRIEDLLNVFIKNKDRIKPELMMPKTN